MVFNILLRQKNIKKFLKSPFYFILFYDRIGKIEKRTFY